MGFKEFSRDLKKLNKDKSTIYVICGSDPYLKDLFFQIIKQKYKEVPVEKLDAKSLSEKEIISNFQSDDLFSDQKMIFVENFDSIRGEKKKLLEYIKNPDEDIILLLISSSDRQTKFKKTLENQKKIIFLDSSPFKIYNEDIEFFIDRLCNVQGFEIDSKSKDLIKKKCGIDLYLISNELRKLFVLKEAEKSINLSDTAKTISQFEQSSVFEIVDSIASKKLENAIKETAALFVTDSNAAMMISYNLYYYFERLIIVKDMLRRGNSEIEISKEIGLPPFVVKKDYIPRARKIKNGEILAILRKLVNLDFQLRQSSLTHRNIIDSFIFNLCT